MRKVILSLLSLTLITGCAITKPEPDKNTEEEKIEFPAYQQFFENIYTADGTDVPLLNTMVKLVVYDDARQTEAYDLLFPLLKEYHQYADNVYDYLDEEGNSITNIKTINESYGTEKEITLAPELFEMLQEAITLSKLTKGYFNPLLGHISQVYDGKFTSFPIENTDPDEDILNQAVACKVNYDELDTILEMNEANSSVIFHKVSGCEVTPKINLGAFSKGYILDRASELLKSMEIPFLLDLGSSSIATYEGQGQSKNAWNIGIRSPFNKLTALYIIQLKGNYSISTSGDDQKYYFKKNTDGSTTIRHHILNPNTGYSENYYRNVTLVASGSENGAVLDALSTAIFSIESLEESKEIIEAVEKYYDIHVYYALTIPKENSYVDIVADEAMNNLIASEMRAEHIDQIIVK